MTAQLLPADATGPPLSLSSCEAAAFIHMLCVAGTANWVKAQCTSVQYPLQWRGWRRARSGRSSVPHMSSPPPPPRTHHHRHPFHLALNRSIRSHAEACTRCSSTKPANCSHSAGAHHPTPPALPPFTSQAPAPTHLHHSPCSGANGRLGLGNTINIAKPAEVTALSSVRVTCDVRLVSRDVHVSRQQVCVKSIACGWSSRQPPPPSSLLFPSFITPPPPSQHVRRVLHCPRPRLCGPRVRVQQHDTLDAVINCNNLGRYTWGHGDSGRLGHGNDQVHDGSLLVWL